MGSILRIVVEMRDYPMPPRLSVYAAADGTVEAALDGDAPKLSSPNEIRRQVDRLVSSWFQPEIWDSGASATLDIAEALIVRE